MIIDQADSAKVRIDKLHATQSWSEVAELVAKALNISLPSCRFFYGGRELKNTKNTLYQYRIKVDTVLQVLIRPPTSAMKLKAVVIYTSRPNAKKVAVATIQCTTSLQGAEAERGIAAGSPATLLPSAEIFLAQNATKTVTNQESYAPDLLASQGNGQVYVCDECIRTPGRSCIGCGCFECGINDDVVENVCECSAYLQKKSSTDNVRSLRRMRLLVSLALPRSTSSSIASGGLVLPRV
jgi:hypothetical protein